MSLEGGISVFFGCDITKIVLDEDFIDMDFVGLNISIKKLADKLKPHNLTIRTTHPNYQNR